MTDARTEGGEGQQTGEAVNLPLDTVDEDWLTDVIDDSIDMDWTGRVGARAIIRAFQKLQEERQARKVCGVCGAVGSADHLGYCSESI